MTADTSAVIAALSAWHEHHELAASSLADITVLPSHVMLESYSVLTRLPGGLAVSGEVAADLLTARFPDPPLRLTSTGQRNLVTRLSGAGVVGGSSYDGLVGLEAATHSQTLLTLDVRAAGVYGRLGVDFRELDS